MSVDRAKNGIVSWLLATLSPRAIDRISVDVGSGAGIAVAAMWIIRGLPVFLAAVVLGVTGYVAFLMIKKVLQWLVATTRESPPSLRTVGIAGVASFMLPGFIAALGAALLLVLWIWDYLLRERGSPPSHVPLRRFLRTLVVVGVAPFMLLGFIASPPAVLLLAFGIWACLLTGRRVRASRYRWVRNATDVLAAVLTGLDLTVLFDRDLLATQPAAVLLFGAGM